MSSHTTIAFPLLLLATLVGSCGSVGCQRESFHVPATEHAARTSTDNRGSAKPAMSRTDIETLWHTRTSLIRESDAKLLHELKAQALLRILHDDCNQVDRDELLDAVAASSGGAADDGFDVAAVGGLIWCYSDPCDRDGLVRVLAKACPERVGLRYVEDWVVFSTHGIADPVTMLFDAYGSSQSVFAKREIAGALRRGFSFAGALPSEEESMVEWCRAWYCEHRAEVVPDGNYSVNTDFRLLGLEKPPGLFVARPR